MKAKCPWCDDGCGRCEEGFFEAILPDGAIYAKQCTEPKCGFANGIHIENPDQPLPRELGRWEFS